MINPAIAIIVIVVIGGIIFYYLSNKEKKKEEFRGPPKQIISINTHFPSCRACQAKSRPRITNPRLDNKYKEQEEVQTIIIPSETPAEILTQGIGANGVKPQAPVAAVIATGENKLKEQAKFRLR